MARIFLSPPAIVTGAGCLAEVGKAVAVLGKRCGIVTGKGSMRKRGVLDEVAGLMAECGVEPSVFEGVENDPSIETIDRVREFLHDNRCDVVLGLGGGSAVDAGKVAAGLYNEDAPTVEFLDGRELDGTGIPVVAAPSTFGTGSEATKVSVLSDHSRFIKKGVRHDCMLPRAAIVDPKLGEGAPASLIAVCGLDALTQAIESYISIYSYDITKALSFNACVLLANGLPRAVKDSTDMDAMENCANGSLMAGMALNNAKLGIVHGLAHPLGIRYGLVHGEACGILLPYALRYNKDAAKEGYSLLSVILGGDPVEFCFKLLEEFGMDRDLKRIEISDKDRAEIIEETLASSSAQANPRKVTAEDVAAMLDEICG